MELIILFLAYVKLWLKIFDHWFVFKFILFVWDFYIVNLLLKDTDLVA